MTTLRDTRTRVVTWLKVLLPLVALGLLSTLFLLARATDPDRAIRFSEVDVSELSRDQQVMGPTYSGVTRDGASISVVAEAIRPAEGAEDRLLASTVSGRIELPAGSAADMEAPSAVIETDDDRARFEGGVTLVTSDGYRMETPTLLTALDVTDIVAEQEVHAVGPPGTLDAGAMRITQDPAGGYVLVFNGGVRLVYDPSPTEE